MPACLSAERNSISLQFTFCQILALKDTAYGRSRPLLETNTQRQVWLSLCGFSWLHKVLFEPSKDLWWVWDLSLNGIFPLLLSCWGFSLALGCGVSLLVGSNILQWTVVQQRVVVLEFSQEKMSARPSTPPNPSSIPGNKRWQE